MTVDSIAPDKCQSEIRDINKYDANQTVVQSRRLTDYSTQSANGRNSAYS